jgi:hypothetical protein
MTAAPTSPTTTDQQADVTSVIGNIDAAAALRDRIADLQKQYKIHADLIKDTLGAATEGIDATGRVIVRYPQRNRSNLDRKLVKTLLSDDEYARCVTETSYRVLLFGED